MEEKKKINRCKFALYRFNDGYNCVQAGWEDDKIQPTDEEKCEACQLFESKYIEYPLTINGIDTRPIKYEGWPEKVGQLVVVRPCGDEYGNKTYVGFYLGDLPKAIIHSFSEKTGILKACTIDNLAIFVPELGEIIWGCESWWHAIRSEEELRKITDEDINDTWYVKMVHRMMQQRKKSSIELKEGDRFQQAWKGCKEPMWFKVLNIDRPNNSLRVECHGCNGGMHEEEWDDLDVTESAFDIGEYKMIEDKED